MSEGQIALFKYEDRKANESSGGRRGGRGIAREGGVHDAGGYSRVLTKICMALVANKGVLEKYWKGVAASSAFSRHQQEKRSRTFPKFRSRPRIFGLFFVAHFPTVNLFGSMSCLRLPHFISTCTDIHTAKRAKTISREGIWATGQKLGVAPPPLVVNVVMAVWLKSRY